MQIQSLLIFLLHLLPLQVVLFTNDATAADVIVDDDDAHARGPQNRI